MVLVAWADKHRDELAASRAALTSIFHVFAKYCGSEAWARQPWRRIYLLAKFRPVVGKSTQRQNCLNSTTPTAMPSLCPKAYSPLALSRYSWESAGGTGHVGSEISYQGAAWSLWMALTPWRWKWCWLPGPLGEAEGCLHGWGLWCQDVQEGPKGGYRQRALTKPELSSPFIYLYKESIIPWGESTSQQKQTRLMRQKGSDPEDSKEHRKPLPYEIQTKWYLEDKNKKLWRMKKKTRKLKARGNSWSSDMQLIKL